MGLLSAVAQVAAKNLVKPVAKRVIPEIANNMPGFYAGGKLAAGGAAGPKIVSGVARSMNRMFNPTQIKQNKLFNETGITKETQNVANKEIAFLESPEVAAVLEKRANKLKLTEKEDKLIKRINETGKILEGQAEWNYLVAKQYGDDTKLLDETLALDNYYGPPVDFNNESVTKGLRLHKPWIAEEHMTPGIEGQILKHIVDVQGVGEKGSLLFVKKPNASNAAGNLIGNMNKKSTNRKVAKEVIRKHGKAFETTEDLYAALSKEFNEKTAEQQRIIKKKKKGLKLTGKEKKVDLKHVYKVRLDKEEGVVFFQDSFTSSSYSLGGVNNVSFMKKDGTIGSTISDKNDLFGIDMPGGKTGLSITPTYFENVLSLKGVPLAKYKKKHKIKMTKKEESSLNKEKAKERKWKESNRSAKEGTMSKALQTAGLNKRQIYLIEQLRKAGKDPLEIKDYIKYMGKMGATGTAAGGLLTSGD